MKFQPEATVPCSCYLPRSLSRRLSALAQRENKRVEAVIAEAVCLYVDERIAPPSSEEIARGIEKRKKEFNRAWKRWYGNQLDQEPGFRWLDEVDRYGNPRFTFTCPECNGQGKKRIPVLDPKAGHWCSCPKMIEGPQYCTDCGKILMGSLHSCRH